VQDDWRLHPRLQINAGVRYEYSPPLAGGFNVNSSDPFGPFGTDRNKPMFAADRNNLGPRLGLIYDMTGDQKLVLRAGGAISYAPPQPFFYYASAFVDPRLPFNATLNPRDLPAGTVTSFPFPQAFINAVIANPNLLPSTFILSRNIADYNRRDEYSGQWNISLQRAVTNSLSAQASYVGSRALKLYAERNVNLRDPILGRRPHPELGDVDFRENAGRSSYHALQLALNQRLKRGFVLDGYYTFSKTLTYDSSDGTQTTDNDVQDPNNIAGSYGPKNGESRHRFVGVGSYAIPLNAYGSSSRWARWIAGGWQLQSIVTARSGAPINVLSGRDLYGNGRVTAQRPDRVNGVDAYVQSSDPLLWLNTAAFDVNTPTTQRRFGNLGFNALRGPGAFTMDAALHRTFGWHESQRLIFRLEAFNVLNHVVLANPTNSLANPNFGRILSGSGGRNVQIALKYMF
jgi:hypothetical protein